MIRWFLSTMLIAVVVAGVMIIYLSPDLRAKSWRWFQQKNQMVEKRIKELRGALPGKTELKQVEEVLLKKSPSSKGSSKPEAQLTQKKPEKSQPPKAPDQIPEQDRKKLEEILEKANK